MNWEYKKYSTQDPDRFEADSNELGKQGWELVSFAFYSSHLVGVFKKEYIVPTPVISNVIPFKKKK